MANMGPADVLERAGTLEKEIIDKAFCQSYRDADEADDVFYRVVETMMRRYARDRQATVGEMWDSVAKRFGYESREAAHEAGYALAIDHRRNSIELRVRDDIPAVGKSEKP